MQKLESLIAGTMVAALWLSISSVVFTLLPAEFDLVIAGAVMTLAAVGITSWHLAKSDWSPPMPSKMEIEYLPWAIIVGIALQFAMSPITRSGMASLDGSVLTAMIITAGIMVPAAEEVFFRYWLWKKLPSPEVTTTLLFALAHIPSWGWNRAVLLLIPGIIFAFFRKRTDGIFPGIGCHMAFNTTGLLLLL